MNIMIKRISAVVIVTVVLALVIAFTFVPKYLDQSSNIVISTQAPFVTSQVHELHQSLTIIDMHEDLLLWNRNPLIRHSYGHTDIPRLIEGNVSLQVFATVTKSPRGLNYESNPADSDMITPLVFFQRWPMKTWFSLKERALYQAEKLHNAERHSQGKFTIIKTREGLTQYLVSREQLPLSTSGLLAIEGLHVLEGKLENLDLLFDAGFRMMGLTHFFDNEVVGSAHGVEKLGLTDLGRQVFKRMESLGIIVDLAHLSPVAMDEVLSMSTQPIVVSHTGVQGTCAGVRNLTDQQIIKIAKKMA